MVEARRRDGLPEDYRLSHRYTAERGTVFLTGIQALARLPLDQLRADRAAGLHTAALVSGYPGSPLRRLAPRLGARLPPTVALG